MEIMVDKPGCIEEVVEVAENVVRGYYEIRSVAEVLTGVLNAKNN